MQLTLKEKLPETLNLEGDPFRIRQITENLLSNALKFTAAGEITLQAEYHGNQFVLRVSDTGCGMTEKEQEKIFKEFTRLRSAQGQEGFGLGLSITRKLVELLGGKIEIESTPGKGSTFQVSMPLPSISSKTFHGTTPTTTQVSERLLRILIIDDDRIQMHLTEAMLHNLEEEFEGLKIKTVCCEHPEELVTELQNGKFDLVFTDIQMPAMNGFELLKHLRSLHFAQAQSIPLIAITARGDMDETDFQRKGFAGMLQKPFSQSDLCRILTHVFSLQTNEAALPTQTGIPSSPKLEEEKSYNFSPLTAFSEDDPKAAREILQTFAQETRKNLKKIQDAMQMEDMESLCAVAHKMLPTFIMIEARKAIPSLQWLEQQRGNHNYCQEATRAASIIVEETKNILGSKILKDTERIS